MWTSLHGGNQERVQGGDQTIYHHCFKLMSPNMHCQRRTRMCLAVFNLDDPEGALPILTLRDAERGALAQSLLHSYCSSTAEVSGVRCEASDGDGEV